MARFGNRSQSTANFVRVGTAVGSERLIQSVVLPRPVGQLLRIKRQIPVFERVPHGHDQRHCSGIVGRQTRHMRPVRDLLEQERLRPPFLGVLPKLLEDRRQEFMGSRRGDRRLRHKSAPD